MEILAPRDMNNTEIKESDFKNVEEFFKNGAVIHSVSITAQQKFWLGNKYKGRFSLSAWVKEKLTREEIERDSK